MFNRNHLWLWVFTLVSVLEIFGEATQNAPLIYFTKPFLMPALLVWFVRETAGNRSRLRGAFIVGLIFSTFGDVFLMLENGRFFLAGVGAFLVAQISYTVGFCSKPNFKASILWQKPWWFLPFFGYIFGMFWFLPGLKEFPFSIYAVAITCMALSAMNLKGWVPGRAWAFCLAGAVFFIASDSLLACRIFGKNFPMHEVLVMLTYIFGQYLLTRGARMVIG